MDQQTKWPFWRKLYYRILLLMEEILHHPGCIKTGKLWEKLHINWCRISYINSISWSPVKWCQDNSSNFHQISIHFFPSLTPPAANPGVPGKSSNVAVGLPSGAQLCWVVGYSWLTRVKKAYDPLYVTLHIGLYWPFTNLPFGICAIYFDLEVHWIHLTNTTSLIHQTHQPKKIT